MQAYQLVFDKEYDDITLDTLILASKKFHTFEFIK